MDISTNEWFQFLTLWLFNYQYVGIVLPFLPDSTIDLKSSSLRLRKRIKRKKNYNFNIIVFPFLILQPTISPNWTDDLPPAYSLREIPSSIAERQKGKRSKYLQRPQGHKVIPLRHALSFNSHLSPLLSHFFTTQKYITYPTYTKTKIQPKIGNLFSVLIYCFCTPLRRRTLKSLSPR